MTDAEFVKRVSKLEPVRRKVIMTLTNFIVERNERGIALTDQEREKILSVGKACGKKNEFTEFFDLINQLKGAMA